MNAIDHIERCLIPKLAKNCDECEHHQEYLLRKVKLEQHFEQAVAALKSEDLMVTVNCSARVLGLVLILHKELLSKGPWHHEEYMEYAEQLDNQIENLYQIKASELLKKPLFDNQSVFDECMKILHLKLTATEFKKYPSLIEVYCMIIEELKEYHNVRANVQNMPISLYLIDDYNVINKKKGLKCCKNILVYSVPNIFAQGNYYEVIYASLKKVFMDRDVELTRLTIDCLLELLYVVPDDHQFKISTSDELYTKVLDQIHTESNLYRKADLFRFTKNLIMINGVNCVSRQLFHTVIYDNLEISTNEGVVDKILMPVLECLQEWIKYCWCSWNIRSGRKLLTALFKVLYINKAQDETVNTMIAKIIATLITLCPKDEKEKFINMINNAPHRCENLRNRLSLINEYIYVT